MRRLALSLAVILLSSAAMPAISPPAAAQSREPPHSWLFGTWTGGIFPAPQNMTREQCFSQPVVIFTRDLVLRATLTDQLLTQRVIETVRSTKTGAEFRFASTARAPSLLGGGQPGDVGFGCGSPDELTIRRRGDNEIVFPECADFPNPLVRCQ